MKNIESNIPNVKTRIFVPAKLQLNNWDAISVLFEDLKNREINSVDELHNWLLDRSELEAVLSEYSSRIWIRMTCDTNDTVAKADFDNFYSYIEPQMQRAWHILNIKFNDSPFKDDLDNEIFGVYKKIIKTQINFYCEENVEPNAEISKLKAEYSKITGAMTIEYNGETMTMQKASLFLKSSNRNIRETVFNKIYARRKEDEQKLNTLFSDLLKLRHKVAINAKYDDFRDYMFQELCRFDYNAQDCFDFHTTIEKNITPIAERILTKRKQNLNLSQLKPWDLNAEPNGKDALKAFTDDQDLISKSIECFDKLHPYFGNCIRKMKAINHLDLNSRIGKAPGGYMSPLYETSIPFIFMNGVGSLKDLVTMVHESGHAFHEFLTAKYDITAFKQYPSEIAELASMSMELLTMDHWDTFFNNEQDLIRAKKEHLEDIFIMLPWIATIDAYQHWLYTNPYHSLEERGRKWIEIYQRFHPKIVNWDGLEHIQSMIWQRQLHLYEVPFYYIEYGMAQLGAIAIWMNFKKDSQKTLEAYIQALSVGYTKSIPDVYKIAGIEFEFSNTYVRNLAEFVHTELTELY